jgi:hypothetical protein
MRNTLPKFFKAAKAMAIWIWFCAGRGFRCPLYFLFFGLIWLVGSVGQERDGLAPSAIHLRAKARRVLAALVLKKFISGEKLNTRKLILYPKFKNGNWD